MELKREAPTPLYVQLKNSLLGQIGSSSLLPHQQLPSERELCEQFGVSRTTVRQAINEMIHEGLVYSRAGKGTFVSEPKINQQLRNLTGFSQDVIERGGAPSSQILEARLIPATPDLAERLQVPLEAELVLLARLRLANGVPLAIETSYLNHSFCSGILRYNFAHESLYRVLQTEYQLRLVRAEQTIEAGLGNSQELLLLQIHPPAAVLKMERLTTTDQEVRLEYTVSVYRGDRYKFRATLQMY